MRFLFWFLLLAVAAVVAALAARLSSGYARLVAAPYRRARGDRRAPVRCGGSVSFPTRHAGEKPRSAAIDALRGNRAGAGAAPGSAADPGLSETRGGHAHRGATARAPRDAGSAAVRPDSAAGRAIGQARRIRRGAGRAGENCRAARAVARTGARCRGLARRMEPVARIDAYAATDRARRGAELPATRRRSRGRRNRRAEPRTRLELRAHRALRRMP